MYDYLVTAITIQTFKSFDDNEFIGSDREKLDKSAGKSEMEVVA